MENNLFIVNRDYDSSLEEESDYPSIYEYNALNHDKKRKYINDYI